MRKNIVAGNWKMNNNLTETISLILGLKEAIKDEDLGCRVMVSPTFVNLVSAVKEAKNSVVEVVAQNMHQAVNGAYTGEVSSNMLAAIDIKTVILGHSERRTYFGEDDAILSQKVNTALENHLEIIFCFGELLEDRKTNTHFTVVENQLKNALFHLLPDSWSQIILAYEPVWAIGTGETASPEQAQEMHAFIRDLIKNKYSDELANNVSILYGGSVKPNNAKEIFSKPDVDGGLIGGASLKVDDFTAIIKAI